MWRKHSLDQVSHIVTEMRRQGRVVTSQDTFEQRAHIICLEWRHEAAHFVNSTAEGPNVTFCIVGFLKPNFGRGVVRCPSLCREHTLLRYFRNVEVTKLGLATLEQKNIGALHVPMQNRICVQNPQAFEDLYKNFPDQLFLEVNLLGMALLNLLVCVSVVC